MSNFKCPFCDKPLQPTHRIEDEYFCENYDCPQTSLTWVGTSSLWKALADTKKKLDVAVDALVERTKELDSTRKALDVAVDAIKSAKKRLELINNSKFANLNNVLQIQCQCEILKIEEFLKQITTPEQKDVK